MEVKKSLLLSKPEKSWKIIEASTRAEVMIVCVSVCACFRRHILGGGMFNGNVLIMLNPDLKLQRNKKPLCIVVLSFNQLLFL